MTELMAGRGRIIWLVTAVGAAVLIIATWSIATLSTSSASASGNSCGGSSPKLTVHGTGLATGTPNLLTLTMGVNVVTASSAANALAEDNKTTNAVTTALHSGGVASKDLQTTGLSIQPNYTLAGTISGYTVTNNIVAKIRDFGSAGAVIDAATAAAGNAARVNSLDFSITDPRRLEDQARHDAVSQAVSHAGTMAAAAGEELGQVCVLTDNSGFTGSTVAAFSSADAAPERGTNGGATVPISPGTQQFQARVAVVYSVVDPKARA